MIVLCFSHDTDINSLIPLSRMLSAIMHMGVLGACCKLGLTWERPKRLRQPKKMPGESELLLIDGTDSSINQRQNVENNLIRTKTKRNDWDSSGKVGPISTVKLWKKHAEKLRGIILDKFELMTSPFAYGRTPKSSFLWFRDSWACP